MEESMKIQTIEYNGQPLKYTTTTGGLLFNSKQICNLLSITKEERANSHLKLPFCDKATVVLHSAATNQDFSEFIILKFDSYPNECCVHPSGFNDNWVKSA